MRERHISGSVLGGGEYMHVFADVLDRELNFTSLKTKRVGPYEWRLRMGLGVKGSIKLSRVNGDIRYDLVVGLGRTPILLSIAIAAASLLLSLFFLFFGFVFFIFLFPLILDLWNADKAEREALDAIESAQMLVFTGTIEPRRRRRCPYCGFNPPNWAVYCPKCGSKL